MPDKNKTQTKKPNLTPKQAQIKAETILRGIDNNNIVIAKKLEANQDAAEQLHAVVPLLGGLTNASMNAKPTLAKTNGTTVKAEASTSTKKTSTKKTKAAKSSSAANGASNGASTKKPTKAVTKPSAKPAAKEDERPPLKTVMHSVIARHSGKPMGAAEIYQAVVQMHKYSRQSLYNALKDTKHFQKVGDGYKNVAGSATHSHSNHSGEKDDADRFVENVEKNQSTASVV